MTGYAIINRFVKGHYELSSQKKILQLNVQIILEADLFNCAGVLFRIMSKYI